jgi:hypothetical protein
MGTVIGFLNRLQEHKKDQIGNMIVLPEKILAYGY